HYAPDGSGVQIAPDVTVYPSKAIVPRPSISTIIPRPPSDIKLWAKVLVVWDKSINDGMSYLLFDDTKLSIAPDSSAFKY
ncbi:4328_t:CDS:2, partial [Acaulospora colombiana]